MRSHAACTPPRTTAPPGEIIAVWTYASASAQNRAPARRRSEAEGARSGTGKNWRHGPSRVVDQGSLPRSLALAGGPHHAPYKKQQLLVVPWWASDRSLADGSRRHCQVDRSIRASTIAGCKPTECEDRRERREAYYKFMAGLDTKIEKLRERNKRTMY